MICIICFIIFYTVLDYYGYYIDVIYYIDGYIYIDLILLIICQVLTEGYCLTSNLQMLKTEIR